MMFWLMNDSKPWFRQKSYGYGAGLPIAWQGWALLAFHIALILGLALLLEHKSAALIAAIIAAAILPLPLYAARTEGGWRWRWGDDK
jgi:hypothetical protein